ncbi:MAG: hypothetical protein EOP46_03195 [Sphingobacteriaceae bacterium]|nr:MAG: hypothetical protein EOP46_03195 [Sphingobacteriaceae bacterium]
MSSGRKKIFFALSIIVPFLLYCGYYYGMMVKNAPYKFAEFKSIVFEYGNGDSLVNKYNSATRNYQFVNSRDSLIKMKLFVSKDELLYLHRKAAELGFWDFPANQINTPGKIEPNVPHFKIQYNYLRKSKTVIFASNFEGPEPLVDANKRLIKEIQRILNDAEVRSKKEKEVAN